MQENQVNAIVEAILNDPPEARWRSVRALSRVEDEESRTEVFKRLNEKLMASRAANCSEEDKIDILTEERIKLAFRMVGGDPDSVMAAARREFGMMEAPADDGSSIPFRVVDVHVHPKRVDKDLLKDFRDANCIGVCLATDTDPADMDRPEVIEHIRQTYIGSDMAREMPFEWLIEEIRSSLRSVTHYSNQDVLDLVTDYPDDLIGFGSVDLAKDPDYVDNTLQWIADNGLRGIKLLPFSQFFDPSVSENADRMMAFCKDHDLIILSHTGCSSGVFESPYLNMHSRPSKWTKLAQKYPEVPIILAHFGAYSMNYPGIWFDEAVELMSKCPNVYADTAAVWRLLWNEEMVQMMRDNGIMDQILFGTDYPMPSLMPGSERGVVLSIMHDSQLTPEEAQKFLSSNALKLFKIDK